MYGVKRLANTNPIFLEFHLMQFADTVELNKIVSMHKAYYNILTEHVHKLFIGNETQYLTLNDM